LSLTIPARHRGRIAFAFTGLVILANWWPSLTRSLQALPALTGIAPRQPAPGIVKIWVIPRWIGPVYPEGCGGIEAARQEGRAAGSCFGYRPDAFDVWIFGRNFIRTHEPSDVPVRKEVFVDGRRVSLPVDLSDSGGIDNTNRMTFSVNDTTNSFVMSLPKAGIAVAAGSARSASIEVDFAAARRPMEDVPGDTPRVLDVAVLAPPSHGEIFLRFLSTGLVTPSKSGDGRFVLMPAGERSASFSGFQAIRPNFIEARVRSESRSGPATRKRAWTGKIRRTSAH